MPLQKLGNAWRLVRRHGIASYAQSVYSTLYDARYEWRSGLDTSVHPDSPKAGAIEPDQTAYVPVPYAVLVPVLRRSGVGPSSHVVDFGCGAGRVLIAANSLGAASATGVELDRTLVNRARANLDLIDAGNPRFQVIEMNALAFEVPDDATHAVFVRPFFGDTLRSVISALSLSKAASRSHFSVVSFNYNDEEFDTLAADAGWEQVDRDVGLSRTRWPLPWAIYETSGG